MWSNQHERGGLKFYCNTGGMGTEAGGSASVAQCRVALNLFSPWWESCVHMQPWPLEKSWNRWHRRWVNRKAVLITWVTFFGGKQWLLECVQCVCRSLILYASDVLIPPIMEYRDPTIPNHLPCQFNICVTKLLCNCEEDKVRRKIICQNKINFLISSIITKKDDFFFFVPSRLCCWRVWTKATKLKVK